MIVLFDIDGTLVDHKFAEKAGAIEYYHKQKSVFKISELEFIKLWGDLADKYFKRYLNKELSFNEQRMSRIKELFRTVGIELTDQDAEPEFNTYLSFYRNYWKAFDDVIPCLNQLSDVQLGIITNGDYEQQIDKLKKVGLIDYFATVVTSGEVGYSKPDKKIFLDACKRVSKSPSDCYYVGDDFGIDILGSNAAGMKGIWINRKHESTYDRNIVNINNLSDLPAIVHSAL